MTHWKHLTDTTDSHVQVNMDHVIYMRHNNEKTTLFFPGSPNETGKTRYLEVAKAPEQILLTYPLRSF